MPSVTRIAYGDQPQQFGDLYLPDDDADDDDAGEPSATVVLIHGGFWRAQYELDLMAPLAEDLCRAGYAVWNIEFRRVAQPGGGWPGTLRDVATAIDRLADVATSQSELGLDRTAFVGHSAGGHLALWAAGRSAIPDGTPGARPAVVPLIAIGQGPVVALRQAGEQQLGNGAVIDFLDGPPDAVPDRYAAATPRLGAGPRMVAVVGSRDDVVPPEFSVDPAQPGAIEVVTIDGADHKVLIDPDSEAWAAVRRLLEATIRSRPPAG
jgi:acetyl esterase/lipase